MKERARKKINPRINQISTASFHVKRSDALKMKSHIHTKRPGRGELRARVSFCSWSDQPERVFGADGFAPGRRFIFTLRSISAHWKFWLPCVRLLLYLFTLRVNERYSIGTCQKHIYTRFCPLKCFVRYIVDKITFIKKN